VTNPNSLAKSGSIQPPFYLALFKFNRRRIDNACEKTLFPNREKDCLARLVIPEHETVISSCKEVATAILSKQAPSGA
jgi:hypothetical protein